MRRTSVHQLYVYSQGGKGREKIFNDVNQRNDNEFKSVPVLLKTSKRKELILGHVLVLFSIDFLEYFE